MTLAPEGRPEGAPRADGSAQTQPTNDAHPAAAFLRLLGKDPAETYFRTIGKRGINRSRRGADLLGFDLEALTRDNANGDAIYFVTGNAIGATGISKKTGKPSGCVTDDDCPTCPALFAEWDDKPIDWQEGAWYELGLPEPSAQVPTGGKSVHNYWILNQPLARAEWEPLQHRLLEHCKADTSISNPSRLMRLPGFNYINKATGKPTGNRAELIPSTTGTRYSPDQIAACLPAAEPPAPARGPSSKPAAKSKAKATNLPPRDLQQIEAAAQFIPERVVGGDTYEECRNALCGCSAALAEAGVADPDGAALDLLASKWPDRATAEQVLRSATTREPASFWRIAQAHGFDLKRPRAQQQAPDPWGLAEAQAEPEAQEEQQEPAPASWAGLIQRLPDGWQVDEETGARKRSGLSAGHLADLLEEHQHLLRYNELTMFVEVHTRRGWCAVVDAAMDSAYVLLSQKGWAIALDPITKAVCHVARLHSFHPVRQYLLDLEQKQQVEAFSLDDVAPRFFRSSNALHVAMVRKWLIGAVARAMDPGCQMDYCLVLQSRQQGIRKTTSLRDLASRDWFTSTVPDGDKDFLLNVHSCWIFELAELESVTGKRDAGRLKNLVSTATDMFRVPYGRTAERRPRGSVFCATVNEDAFLRDETGNRRYWVVPIEGSEPLDREGLKAARDGIWRAAIAAWRAGELPMLTRAQEALSEIQNGEFIQSDPWLAMLRSSMETTVEPRAKCWSRAFSTAEALLAAGLKDGKQINRADENRIAPLLRQLGFEKGKQQRKDGRVVRLWQPITPGQAVTTVTTVTTSDSRGCDTPDALQRSGSQQTSQPSQPICSERWGSIGGAGIGGAGEQRHPSLVAKKVVTVVTPAPNAPRPTAATGAHPVTTSGENGCDGVVTVVTPQQPALLPFTPALVGSGSDVAADGDDPHWGPRSAAP